MLSADRGKVASLLLDRGADHMMGGGDEGKKIISDGKCFALAAFRI